MQSEKELLEEVNAVISYLDNTHREPDRGQNSLWNRLVHKLVRHDLAPEFSKWNIEIQEFASKLKIFVPTQQYEFDIMAKSVDQKSWSSSRSPTASSPTRSTSS